MKKLLTALLTTIALVPTSGVSYGADQTTAPQHVIATFTGTAERTVSFTVPVGEMWYVKWSGAVDGWAASHSADPGDIPCNQPRVICFNGPNNNETSGTQAMRQAGWGHFWMFTGSSLGKWSVEIVATGSPQPPTNLPALHQAIAVHGTPDQPE